MWSLNLAHLDMQTIVEACPNVTLEDVKDLISSLVDQYMPCLQHFGVESKTKKSLGFIDLVFNFIGSLVI